MQKHTLTVEQIVLLSQELNILLSQRMTMANKYRLSKFASPFIKIAKRIEESRVELIKKFGEKRENGDYNVVNTPGFEEFKKEYGDLLALEETVSTPRFELNWIETIETEGSFPELFALLEKDDLQSS